MGTHYASSGIQYSEIASWQISSRQKLDLIKLRRIRPDVADVVLALGVVLGVVPGTGKAIVVGSVEGYAAVCEPSPKAIEVIRHVVSIQNRTFTPDVEELIAKKREKSHKETKE